MGKVTTNNRNTQIFAPEKAKKAVFSCKNLFDGTKVAIADVTTEARGCNITIQSKCHTAVCPCCGQKSRKVHSEYHRTLDDLPLSIYRTRLKVRVRRFLCSNPTCSKRTFAERFCNEIVPYQRSTQRRLNKIILIGSKMSSEEAQKTLQYMDKPVSSSTILRHLHKVKIADEVHVQKIGIDDWAQRKGVNYGSIIINLSPIRFIGLLGSREKEDFGKWLKAHPEVDIVSRDRASAYSAAVAETARDITEIADRFHLVKNMSECLLKVLHAKHEVYKSVVCQMRKEDYLAQNPESTFPLSDLEYCHRNIVYDFFVNKMSLGAIRKKLKEDGVQFTDEEFSLRYNSLTTRLRNRVTLCPNCTAPTSILPIFSPPILATYIEKQIRKKDIPQEAKREIDELMKLAWFKDVYQATSSFYDMIKERKLEELKPWEDKYRKSINPEIRTLAIGLQLDHEAVSNSLRYDISNGIVEGYVNKLKTFKRTMYGRASIRLLEKKLFLNETMAFT